MIRESDLLFLGHPVEKQQHKNSEQETAVVKHGRTYIL